MAIKNVNPRMLVLVIIVLSLAAFRILQSSPTFSWLSNFTPIGAMALFAGYYFSDRAKAFMIPLTALWISDILINRLFYFDHWVAVYGGFYWVYGTFLMMVMVGRMMTKANATQVIGASIGTAILHYVITDFSVWLGGTDVTTGLPFTKDFAGFVRCYTLAFPFFVNMLMANLAFGALLFGGFEWLQRRNPVLRATNANA